MFTLKSTILLLVLFNFTLAIVSSTDDGQWKKEDLPKEEAMDEDEPLMPPTKNSNNERTKKSFDLNSTTESSDEQAASLNDKKLDDLKDEKDAKDLKDSVKQQVSGNDKMGRSSATYGLDELINAKDEKDNKDDKEGRIMNADDEMILEKPKMNIQGFIPVVGLAGAALGSAAALNSIGAQKRQRLFSSSSDSFGERFSNQQPSMPNYMLNQNQFNPASLSNQQNQYQQMRFGQPPRSERRRFSSTLQNLASSLTGSVNKLAKRKQVVDYSSFAQECICMPFYMCRSGFIEQTAKHQPGAGQTFQMAQYNQYRDQSLFEKQLQDAQSELNKYYSPQQISELLAGLGQQDRSQPNMQTVSSSSSNSNEQYQESQRNYATINSNSNSNSDLELPINERSIDGKQATHFLDSANNTELQALSRMLGLANAFSNKNDQNGQSCGMLRTCCPLLSSKDILVAHQSINGNEPHGYVNTFRQQNQFQQQNHHQFQQQRPPMMGPIHSPPSMHTIGQSTGYPALPIPVMPQLIQPQQQQSYPMMASNIQYESGNVYQPPNQVNFNRQLNRKSLDRSPYSNLNNNYDHHHHHRHTHLNLQSKSTTYGGMIRQFGQSTVYNGKCGIKPTQFNQARVQNLNYPASSTEFGEFHWQSALLKRIGPQDSLFVCGATLISDQWVAAAAHCIKKNTALDLKVRLGEWDVHRYDEFYPYVEKEVAQIIKHPQFYPGTLENDIALIRLETPIQLAANPHILPVCLPYRGENFAGKKCWTVGWGKNAFGHQGEYQSVLKKVDLPVIGHSTCNSILKRTKLGPDYDLHAGFMCAGGERGKDACEGDGGSALVCDVNGVWKAAGMVSWGIGCGKQGLPGVYTNLGYYENWIKETIGESERADSSEELANRYNLEQAGRVLADIQSSGSVGTSLSNDNNVNMMNNMNNMNNMNDNNDNESDNNLYEPASIINERSNSAVVNGTESDELVISGSFTQAPSLLNSKNKNSTST